MATLCQVDSMAPPLNRKTDQPAMLACTASLSGPLVLLQLRLDLCHQVGDIEAAGDLHVLPQGERQYGDLGRPIAFQQSGRVALHGGERQEGLHPLALADLHGEAVDAFHRCRAQVAAGGLAADLDVVAEGELGLGRLLADVDAGPVAVHLGREHADVDVVAFLDFADHFRLVQESRVEGLQLDEIADVVATFTFAVLLGADLHDTGLHHRADLEGRQVELVLFQLANEEHRFFVEHDAGLRRTLFRLLQTTFDAVIGQHAGFLDEGFDGEQAGVLDQEGTARLLVAATLADQQAGGDETVGVALDGHDQTAVGVLGDGRNGAADHRAADDGDDVAGVHLKLFPVKTAIDEDVPEEWSPTLRRTGDHLFRTYSLSRAVVRAAAD